MQQPGPTLHSISGLKVFKAGPSLRRSYSLDSLSRASTSKAAEHRIGGGRRTTRRG